MLFYSSCRPFNLPTRNPRAQAFLQPNGRAVLLNAHQLVFNQLFSETRLTSPLSMVYKVGVSLSPKYIPFIKWQSRTGASILTNECPFPITFIAWMLLILPGRDIFPYPFPPNNMASCRPSSALKNKPLIKT